MTGDIDDALCVEECPCYFSWPFVTNVFVTKRHSTRWDGSPLDDNKVWVEVGTGFFFAIVWSPAPQCAMAPPWKRLCLPEKGPVALTPVGIMGCDGTLRLQPEFGGVLRTLGGVMGHSCVEAVLFIDSGFFFLSRARLCLGFFVFVFTK